jgi:hypothetical protein
MALIRISLVLVGLTLFLLGQLIQGSWILRKLRLEFESFPEHFLVSVCTGVILTEIGVSLAEWTQHIRIGSFLVLFLSWLPAGVELPNLLRKAKSFVQRSLPLSSPECVVLWSIGAALLMELMASLAPLTGSDALNYHFTTQKLILELGFHPIFYITNSFLCGQSHLLILLGLALGGESLAMSFLFLGGALATLAVACLSARWVPRFYGLGAALLFLLTPLVFWQFSSSGSPDIWMATFVGAAVLVISSRREDADAHHALLAGFLAGGVAGAKYTGCVIAAALGVAFLAEYRSAIKGFLFFLAALFSGIWPFLRNLIWTGDPVFPTLASRLIPERVNPYALGDFLNGTRVPGSHSPFQAIPFLFFSMGQTGASPGLWEFFGPMVFAIAPLVFLAWRNTREWRVRTFVWFSAGLGIFLVSGLIRYLLPLLPVAFSCAAAGVYYAEQKGWVQVHRLATLSVLLACLMGAGGLALYMSPAILAATGVEDRQHYLRERAPEYQVSEAVNQAVGSPPFAGRTLVFLRHLYYLRIPFILGNPSQAWQINPDSIKTPGDWRAFFHDQHIAYVVRAPSYPKTIAPPLEELEREGKLVPYSKSEVQNFQGMRIAGMREAVTVTILRVVPDDSEPLPQGN